MKINRTAITILLTIMLFQASLLIESCGLTEPSPSKTALNQLIVSLKEVPQPIVTENNSDNWGLQRALSYCDMVSPWRNNLVNLLEDIRDEWLSPEYAEGRYTWMFHHSDGESHIRFELTFRDSLYFSISYEGPTYTGWKTTPSYGWYSSDLKQGRMTHGSEYLFWREIPEFYAIGGEIASMGIGVIDSTDGGGYLGQSDPVVSQIQFEAGWDGLGHGWYRGFPGGSGDW